MHIYSAYRLNFWWMHKIQVQKVSVGYKLYGESECIYMAKTLNYTYNRLTLRIYLYTKLPPDSRAIEDTYDIIRIRFPKLGLFFGLHWWRWLVAVYALLWIYNCVIELVQHMIIMQYTQWLYGIISRPYIHYSILYTTQLHSTHHSTHISYPEWPAWRSTSRPDESRSYAYIRIYKYDNITIYM